jgi:hypothetical protein
MLLKTSLLARTTRYRKLGVRGITVVAVTQQSLRCLLLHTTQNIRELSEKTKFDGSQRTGKFVPATITGLSTPNVNLLLSKHLSFSFVHKLKTGTKILGLEYVDINIYITSEYFKYSVGKTAIDENLLHFRAIYGGMDLRYGG